MGKQNFKFLGGPYVGYSTLDGSGLERPFAKDIAYLIKLINEHEKLIVVYISLLT